MVSDASRPGGRWVALLAPLAVGIVAFLAARWAMLPGLAFWDTAELQAVGPLLGTAHPTGFPTYVLLGWLVDHVLMPFGEPAVVRVGVIGVDEAHPGDAIRRGPALRMRATAPVEERGAVIGAREGGRGAKGLPLLSPRLRRWGSEPGSVARTSLRRSRTPPIRHLALRSVHQWLDLTPGSRQ